jgi:hypothetical protein
MPRAFDITAATETINLSASGQGELAFTVSNALRRPVRARATVMMAGQARREWATLSGGEERDFAPDGTQQFTVKLQVPPGTPPGSYTFHLLVTDVANPDEQYAEGPTVAFVVPEAAPPVKKPFPWWIVALAAGVIIITGGVAAILASRGGPELGSNCGPGDTCPERQKCTTLMGTRACLLAPGERCTGDGQCSSLFCNAGRCSRDDGQCESNSDCRPPSQCHTNNLCLLPNGEECRENGVCMSGFCQNGQCQTAPKVCSPPCPPGFLCVLGTCRSIKILPRVNEELILRERIQLPGELNR